MTIVPKKKKQEEGRKYFILKNIFEGKQNKNKQP